MSNEASHLRPTPPIRAELCGVSFTYKGAAEPSLRDISLTIPAGQCVLVTGPSGGGKSTLLRLLNGLAPHYHPGELAGKVELSWDAPDANQAELLAAPSDASQPSVVGNRINPSSDPLWRTGELVSTVFQNPRTQFYATDSTSELAFSLENAGVDPGEIRARIGKVASEMGIELLLGRSLFKLSGGEKQLIAGASARVTSPGLYLFDEPTSNLSPAAIDVFGDFIAGAKATGSTVVIAEHRLHFLRKIVDRAIVVADGAIVADMPGEDFFGLSDSERSRLGLRSLVRIEPDLPTTTANGAPTSGLALDAGAGLTLTDLRANYRSHEVLHIDSLAIPAGQLTALVGPNGAGKSTLAHVLTGLKAAKGTIALNGRRMRPKDLLKASYLVMQDVHRQLFSDSVRDELTLGLTAEAAAALDVDGLLARFGLSDVADRHPLALSGGQKQRVVVAAAMAADREVYVFDEPSSGLDRAHLEEIASSLRALADAGKVLLLITHDPELLACADSAIELRKL